MLTFKTKNNYFKHSLVFYKPSCLFLEITATITTIKSTQTAITDTTTNSFLRFLIDSTILFKKTQMIFSPTEQLIYFKVEKNARRTRDMISSLYTDKSSL